MKAEDNGASRRERRHFSAAQKVAIVKRHLVDGVPVSDLCDEQQILPRSFISGSGPSRGGDISSLRPPRTVYIVEHRDNANATWVVLGTYPTEREAQAALFRAVEHGQIAGAAPAESRIRAVRLSGSSQRKR